jgi:hypothetical protein
MVDEISARLKVYEQPTVRFDNYPLLITCASIPMCRRRDHRHRSSRVARVSPNRRRTFRTIVRRKSFIKDTILITSLVVAFCLSMNNAAQSGRAAGRANCQDGLGLESQGCFARSVSQQPIPENQCGKRHGHCKGPRSILILDKKFR